MQDQTGAHSPDRTALSGHRPSRELAPHPPHQHTYYKMGNEEMGRDSSRFWKKGISFFSLSASDSFRNFTVVLILFFKRNNMRFYTEEDILDKHIGKIGSPHRDQFENEINRFLTKETTKLTDCSC